MDPHPPVSHVPATTATTGGVPPARHERLPTAGGLAWAELSRGTVRLLSRRRVLRCLGVQVQVQERSNDEEHDDYEDGYDEDYPEEQSLRPGAVPA